MRLRTCLCAAALASACYHAPDMPEPLNSANQLIVVTTTAWDSITGELQRYERNNASSAWRSVGNAVPIVVGKTGLAWGTGFDQSAAGDEPHKHEGDGRSPAGIFPVTPAFGFAPTDPTIRIAYKPLLDTTECVDDTASVHYNKVVDRGPAGQVDWNSSEHMRRVAQYRIGAVIDYNAQQVKGRGSCIFFHIWSGPHSPTVGCTAMDASELQQVLAWLDPRAQPVVVQLPAASYARLKESWKLP